jgi:tRNA modification GTPase
MLEISCHGNPFIIQKILEDLCKRGCRLAEPGEFTRTAFVNGKMDLSQAEAVGDTIHAQSEAALRVAQNQLAGVLGRKINGVMDALFAVAAQWESRIDFPEEDLPDGGDDSTIAALEDAQATLGYLESTARYRPLLDCGIGTVLIGPPNGGKSSILNGLIGKERALVSHIPGTTRDFLEEFISVDNWCLRIIDTAGIRQSKDMLERLGMRRSLEKLRFADFVLLIFDGSVPLENLDDSLGEILMEKNGLIVLNKRDLPRAIDDGMLPGIPWPKVSVSALDCGDMAALRQQIIDTLKSNQIVPDGAPCVVNARHRECLLDAIGELNAAKSLVKEGASPEFVAAKINYALHGLARITGRETTETILDQIFNKFCIGK